jgi:hypothetical protein
MITLFVTNDAVNIHSIHFLLVRLYIVIRSIQHVLLCLPKRFYADIYSHSFLIIV